MSQIPSLLRTLLVVLLWLPGAPLVAQPFTDLVDFPTSEANWDRFYDLEAHLGNRFDADCADRLCEGDYSNLRALQLRCSVNVGSALVHACSWVFVASALAVDPGRGQVQVDNRRWTCPLPLGAGVAVEVFHAALEVDEPLQVTLPGAARSIGAAVGDCLQAPPPAPAQQPSIGPFVDARDYPRPGQGHASFRALEDALVLGFDNICGDTFCEGEYHNLRAMRLGCSVQAATGQVGECIWTFAGSNMDVDARSGRVQVDARSWACRLPLAAKTDWRLLLDTLQGADAIDKPLPGTGSSVYDGLTGCL